MKLGFVITFVFSYMLWVFLNLSLSPDVLLIGVPVGLVVAALCSRFLIMDFKASYLSPIRLVYFVRYVAEFIAKLVKANLNIINIILDPSLKIRPGVFRIPVVTKSDFVLTGVSNSITLTPGTITVDAEEGFVYVHQMDSKEIGQDKRKEDIVGGFERYLKGVFE